MTITYVLGEMLERILKNEVKHTNQIMVIRISHKKHSNVILMDIFQGNIQISVCIQMFP